MKLITHSTLFIVFFLTQACSPTIKKKTIENNYANIQFTPDYVSKNIGPDFTITIKPIDAISINRETFEAAQRDGNYEKEVTYELNKLRADIDNMKSKVERQYYRSKVKSVEYLQELISNGNIPPFVGSQLQRRILLADSLFRSETGFCSQTHLKM